MNSEGVLSAQDDVKERSTRGRPSLFSGLLAAVLLATILLVFVLPLFIPGKPVHGISASYLAGFNNSVAVLGATSLSLSVLLLTILLRRRQPASLKPIPVGGELGWRFTAAVIACSSVILGIAGTLVTAAHQRYLGDAGYLIEQASTWNETGRKLYSQIEFAYGPLLLLPEIWLSRLAHINMTEAYFVVLVAQSALGLWMLAFLLNELPIRPRLRQAALILFALGAITPHLGLNYTFFRFASPLALFLLAAKRASTPGPTAVLLSLAIAIECAISPELAFALALGIAVYAAWRAWHDGRAWLLTGVTPIALLAALLLSVGHGYLHMVSTFAAGVYNLPVGPYPHILILLFALVWLVPVYLGRSLLRGNPRDACILALYVIALAMVPAALRRCDPLHAFFNGVGIFLLSMAAVSQAPRSARTAWVLCFAFLVLWEHRVDETLFAWRTAYTVQGVLLPKLPSFLRPPVIALVALPDSNVKALLRQPPQPQEMPDLQALYRIIGNEPVAIPFEISPLTEAALKRSQHYQPLYHAFGVDMMDDTAERRAVDELEHFHWLLLPTQLQLSNFQQTTATLGPLQGMRMYFRPRNSPAFIPGDIFDLGITRSWVPERTFGGFTLYRRSPLR